MDLVALSTVARGLLSGKLTDVARQEPKDSRHGMPRFEPSNYAGNLKLLPAYLAVAREVGCTPAQLALAWLLHKAPHVIPLFGTISLEHLAENVAAANVKLGPAIMAKVEGLINQQTVVGNRYSAQSNSEVDTEVF